MDIANLNDMAGELRRLTQCPTEDVPPGWKTRAELETVWNVSTSVAIKLLRAGITNGLVESRRFRVDTPRGCYNTPHYKPILSP